MFVEYYCSICLEHAATLHFSAVPCGLGSYRQCILASSRESHHQGVAAGLQRAEADAEQDRRRESVVVQEAPAVNISVLAVQGQVSVCVAWVEHGAEVDFQRDGLNPTVHTDVPLTFRKRE